MEGVIIPQSSGYKAELLLKMGPGRGLVFLFGLFLFFYFLVSLVMALLMAKMPDNMAGALRVATVLQDLMTFILPAVLTAMAVSRLPARFLFVDYALKLWPAVVAVATLYAAMPWMNCVIEWNRDITFPAGMEDIEDMLRSSEAAAEQFTNQILAGTSVGALIVSICIVGLLAGLSEELFFRGAMLRLFTLTRMNIHCAIWLTAFVFSLMHFQFFGFVPRMLLGAFFGYLTWWSRCLWVPVIVHAVNNSTVVCATWTVKRQGGQIDELAINSSPGHWAMVVGSLLLTAIGLYFFWYITKRRHEPTSVES